nr:IS6 family transposase [Candidatus Odyssella thessalonicensis]
MKSDFWKRRFSGLIILQCMRWYLRYPLSYRQLSEMISERGIKDDHTTIYRCIQHYAPEFEKRIRWYARPLASL